MLFPSNFFDGKPKTSQIILIRSLTVSGESIIVFSCFIIGLSCSTLWAKGALLSRIVFIEHIEHAGVYLGGVFLYETNKNICDPGSLHAVSIVLSSNKL